MVRDSGQAGALSHSPVVTRASLDKAAHLLCAYDPENDHPRDVVLAILEATMGRGLQVRDTAGRSDPR